MSKTDDCSSGLHDYCNICDCECHGEYFTKEELEVLYKFLEKEYIPYDNAELQAVVRKIGKVVQ